VLDFREKSDLKAIFDSGLRPTNVRGLEILECEVRDAPIDFIVAPNHHLRMNVDQARFRVDADDNISEVFAKSPNLPLREVYDLSTRLFQEIGPVRSDLKMVFDESRRARSYEKLKNVDVRLAGVPGVRVWYVPGDFVPRDPQQLYVRVGITLYWKDRLGGGKLRRTPITPPDGYKHESMTRVLSEAELRRRADLQNRMR
jgi:hypothetical protein